MMSVIVSLTKSWANGFYTPWIDPKVSKREALVMVISRCIETLSNLAIRLLCFPVLLWGAMLFFYRFGSTHFSQITSIDKMHKIFWNVTLCSVDGRVAPCLDHLQNVPDSLPQEPTPVYEKLNFEPLLKLFDQLVSPECEPVLQCKTDTEDDPYTLEELRHGITLLQEMLDTHMVEMDRAETAACLRGYIASLIPVLNAMSESPDEEERMWLVYILIELARAGARQCPTRIAETVRHIYNKTRFNQNTIDSLSFEEKIVRFLQEKRMSIINHIFNPTGSAHISQTILINVSKPLGLPPGIFNDDPTEMLRFSPQKVLPVFFKEYNTTTILSYLSDCLNGEEIPGRPKHERTNRRVPMDQTIKFLLKHFTANEVLEFLDSSSNTLKTDGVNAIAIKLGILAPSPATDVTITWDPFQDHPLHQCLQQPINSKV